MKRLPGLGMLLLVWMSLVVGVAVAQEPIPIDVDATVTDDRNELTEYELDLAAGQVVEITLESPDFDTYLEVLDETGAIINENDDIDFPSNTNSRVILDAGSGGTFFLRVRSFTSDTPDGEYTIAVMAQNADDDNDLGELNYDEIVEFAAEGAVVTRFSFEGEAGDAVTVRLRGETEDVILLTLLNPDDSLLAEGGVLGDADLVRVELPEDGTYALELRNDAEGDPLFGDFELALEKSMILLLNDDAYEVVFDEFIGIEAFDLDVVEGEAWIITVTAPEALQNALRLEIYETDALFAIPRLNYNGFEIVSFLYTPDVSGRARIAAFMSLFSDEEVALIFEAEPLED